MPHGFDCEPGVGDVTRERQLTDNDEHSAGKLDPSLLEPPSAL
eukprot:CAMPEP_0204367836 /NCGR_PEP_ID=MMETSP0469-20131031/43745_1 /ASSEMBLY_ACC=CAM_ASM_000384 /TAXON_ID=2969 /ORGANISM="Oxyrrhis marina" /LENGTH=42 /DNA_ID= /DNA_START= /DNA_END= /DNA_ORIENTATION=